MYKGFDKLKAVERKHLREVAGVKTTADLEMTFDWQARMRTLHPKATDPCFDCRRIAKKLGYPIEVEQKEGVR